MSLLFIVFNKTVSSEKHVQNKLIPTFKALQQRIKKAAKPGCCFELDVTDLMDHCQMEDTLSEEVQIISCYLDLTAGEGEEEVGEDGEDDTEFNQHTQLMVNIFS